MNSEKLGEIFVDGRIVNLDSSSIDVLETTMVELTKQKASSLVKINKILSEI
jgi:hypothetical protein